MAGRNSLLTPDRVETIKKALESGNYDHVAYTRAGISKSTFYAWLDRGNPKKVKKNGDPYAKDAPFVEFLDMVTRARVEGEAKRVDDWQEDGKGDWRSHMEFLSRRYPERWSRQERVDITSKQERVEGFTWIIKTGEEDAGNVEV